MSRWSKNRFGQTIAVSLEKENNNKPGSGSRTVGTIGKWGNLEFTSIRSSIINVGALCSTSPNQIAAVSPNQNEINDKLNVEVAPKPRKFFKSRNAPQTNFSPDYQNQQLAFQHQQQQQCHQQIQSPNNNQGDEEEAGAEDLNKKSKKKKVKLTEKKVKEKPPKPEKLPKPPKPEKVSKPKKERKSKAKLVEEENIQDQEALEESVENSATKRNSRSSRISSRARNKVVNYNEDADEEEFNKKIERIQFVPSKTSISSTSVGVPVTATAPVTQTSQILPPTQIASSPEAGHTPTSQPPKIVLRISKGTSRLVSTDNEDAIKSPVHNSDSRDINLSNAENSDTVSENLINSKRPSLDNHSDNSAPTIVSPKPQYIEPPVPEEKPLKIKIKTGFIRSYQESLEKSAIKSVEASSQPSVSFAEKEEGEEKLPTRVTRRRNKIEKPESVQVASVDEKSEEKDFDSQSSILGSIRSNSAASSTSTTVHNSAYLPDSRVIHSRGSSVVTSDLDNTSQQSSLAAAPPSDLNLDNTSTDNVASIELKSKRKMQPQVTTPEVPPPEKEIRGRRSNRRGKNLVEEVPVEQANVPTVPETIFEEPAVQEGKKESPKKRGRRPAAPRKKMKAEEPETPTRTSGRLTRNKVATQENQDAETSPPPTPVVSPVIVPKVGTASVTQTTTTRAYGRKRKNPQPIEEDMGDRLDQGSDQMSTTVNLSQATDEHSIMEESSSQYRSDTVSNAVSEATTILSSQNSSVDNNFQQPEYKHKKLLKRTWMEDRLNAYKSSSQQMAREIPSIPATVEIEQKDEEQQPVKLVISKKKGSIFKSRALVKDEDNSKKRHVYKHKWDNDNSENPEMDDNMEFNENESEVPQKKANVNPSTHNANKTYFEDFDNGESSGLTRIVKNTGNDNNVFTNFDDAEDEVASLRCDKKMKKFYTVVRNVKKAHQIQEIGEFQEMDDDVEYILSALQPDNQVATRCLSALQLASKCMIPSFRMHVRAHGIVTKFFKALSDATRDPGLGLCTAMVMFVLSLDNLNMDLDHDSLKLMLSLLDCDSSNQAVPRGSAAFRQLEEKKNKIRELCEDIQSQGKVIHFNLDNISVGLLAMETLLSLTSKRAGEWFKEELRKLGGIEHIIKTVCECCEIIDDYVAVWDEPMKEKLNKISRCNRVLENVTQLNDENLKYVLEYRDHLFVKTLYKTFKLMDRELIAYPTNDKTPKDDPGVAIREALVPMLKILITLTHPFSEIASGTTYVGGLNDIYKIVFHLLLQGPNYVPDKCVFDLSLLSLLLLNNLTQYNKENRLSVIQLMVRKSDKSHESVPAIQALVEYYYKCEDIALNAERNADKILETPKSKNDKKVQSQEEVQETVDKLLAKAGNHMEHTMMGAFCCLLIGSLIMDNKANEVKIRRYLKNGTFEPMVKTLRKYYDFILITASSEASVVQHVKITKNTIDYLEKCDSG